MRHCRFVLMLLMFLLPLQSVWAAGASVCLHQADEAWHVGHHVHHAPDNDAPAQAEAGEHLAHPGEVPDSSPEHVTDPALEFDTHCATCHGVGTAALMPAPSWHASDTLDRFGVQRLLASSDHIPVLFLRPPIPSLA
jgi:hypothetical protein